MLSVNYRRLGLRSGHRLLDLGCGFGRHAYEAARRGAKVVACDLAWEELTQVRAMYAAISDSNEPYPGTCQVTRADVACLPFPSHSFDKIIASEVLEHVNCDKTALRELARMLSP